MMSEPLLVFLVAAALGISVLSGCSGARCDWASWRGRQEGVLSVVRGQPSALRTDVLVSGEVLWDNRIL